MQIKFINQVFFVLYLLFNFSADSFANAETMNESVQKIPNRLIACGITKIREFSLIDFRNELSEIQFFEANKINNAAGSIREENRSDGGYAFAQKIVFVTDLNKVLRDVRVPFLLHESLGALGYNDDNYEYSSALIALDSESVDGCNHLSTLVNESNLFDHFKYLIKTPFQEALLAYEEGGSHVGGGGDQHGVYIKSNLIINKLFVKPIISDRFSNLKLINLKIENDPSYFTDARQGNNGSSISKICSDNVRYDYDQKSNKFIFNFRSLKDLEVITQINDLQCGVDIITSNLK